MHDFVVYTAISNGYDRLKKPLAIWQKEADFVAFLDEPATESGWITRPIYQRFRDPCRNAKIHKILPHKYFPGARYSLWIDGCVRLNSTLSLNNWIDEYLGENDLAVCKHWLRDCIYQEGFTCLKWGWDSSKLIKRQMQKYHDEGYPTHNGLAECTVILRRHTKAVEQFNEAWYEEIKAGSRRDQLSFNYVAHKLGFKYSHLQGSIHDNPHFRWLPHTAMRDRPK